MNKKNAWAEIREFADIEGRRITQFEVMEGPDKGKKVLKGKIVLTVKPPHPSMPAQKIPFEFDFPEDKTLNWCKKNFDDEANQAVQEWEKAQKKAQAEARRQIVPAQGIPQMLGPDGKPLQPKG